MVVFGAHPAELRRHSNLTFGAVLFFGLASQLYSQEGGGKNEYTQ